jgi:hypothetical protein
MEPRAHARPVLVRAVGLQAGGLHSIAWMSLASESTSRVCLLVLHSVERFGEAALGSACLRRRVKKAVLPDVKDR